MNWKDILEKERDNISQINYAGTPMYIDKIDKISDKIVSIYCRDIKLYPTNGGQVIPQITNISRKTYINLEHIVMISTKTEERISDEIIKN